MKTNPYSAAGIRESEAKANLNNKPVVNSSKNRIYDGDLDYIDIHDRRETKKYASDILALIEKQKGNWISGPQIRRKLGIERIRMWDAALGLLVDKIETKGILIPHYRREDLKRAKIFTPDKWMTRKRTINKLIPLANLPESVRPE